MGSYQYEPLSCTKRQIRIFTLLPSPELDSALRGRLKAVDFDSALQYEALSYVWGEDPPLNHVIDINGSPALISPHLANALKHIRQLDSERDLWIDTLCIDQSSIDERGRQVTMMGDVYRKCVTDLVWLENPPGLREEEDGSSQDASSTLQIATVEEGLDFIKERSTCGITLRNFGGHQPGRDVEAKLKAFFGASLWSRVWIVQELACAKNVLLLSGKKRLKWDTLSKFLDCDPGSDIYHSNWGRAIFTRGLPRLCTQAAEIDRQRYIIHSRLEESTLFDVLARFCDRKSCDTRDRVFGLLGLVSPHRSRLEANYASANSPAKVFIEATKEIIWQSQNLDVLCQSPWERRGVPQCSRCGPRTTGLPSWAVDFAAKKLFRNVGGGFRRTRELMFAGRGIFSAGGDFCEDSWRVLDGTVLQLRGYLLGQIGPPQPQPPSDLSMFRPAIWGDEVTNEIYEATGESKFRALWRTMVTDCTGYPMKRLDQESIDRDDTIFQSLPGKSSWKLPYRMMWQRIHSNWNFYVSREGLYVMARKHVLEGDYIAVIEGAKVPLILQSVSDGRFEIVSPAYVHGYMDKDTPIQDSRLSKRDLFIV